MIVVSDIRTQVQRWLRTLANHDATDTNHPGFHRLDVAFGGALAEYEHLSLTEVVVAARLLRRYWQQLDTFGATLPDEATIINWAIEQDEVISTEETEIADEL